MGQKRGQVTVYIIIGIIVLVSVSMFLYMKSVKVEAPVTYKPTIEQVPLEAEPIKEFVTSCLRTVAEDGLKKVGDYGGYTSVEDMRASLNLASPTESEAVQFSRGSDLIIPYWWYLKSPNDCLNCQFSSKRPNLYRTQGGINIEEQLDKYVNENLKSCLRDFVDFAEFGFEISEAGDIETKTVVTQKSVAFHIQYPLVAEKAGVSYHLNEYFVDIPLNLMEIYNFATNITNNEIEYNFLEKYMKNTIAMFSRVDKDMLPPFSDTRIDTRSVTWSEQVVENRLISLMTSYIPMLQVSNTKGYTPIMFDERDKYQKAKLTLFNNAMLFPNMEPHPQLETRFVYLDWWKPYFEINCKDKVCGPEEASGIGTIVFFIQRYHFKYDISLPVLVDIINPYAFNGKGFSFKFFLEANMRDNEPMTEEMEAPLIVPGTGGNTMLCDADKRNSENITVEIFDPFIGRGVEGVTINYECGEEQCYIGQTDEDGLLKAKYPLCAGGILQVDKDAYHGTRARLSTLMEEPEKVTLSIYPLLKRDIEVRKYKIKKSCVPVGFIQICGWDVDTITNLSLSPDEEATIIMRRHTEPWESPFQVFAEYTGKVGDEDYSEGVEIIPGNYDIEITTLTRKEITIPKDKRCEGGFAGIGETCSTLPAMEFDSENPFFSGGLKLENVRITAGSLASSDKIVLYALTVALEDILNITQRKHEDPDEVNKIEDYSRMYRSKLLPTYETYEVEETRGEETTII